MSEDLADSPLPGIEPVAEDEEQSAGKTSSETDDSEVAAAQSTREEDFFSDRVGTLQAEVKEEDDNDAGGEPSIDWFEPLEDDEDDFSFDRNDPEEESLAGESESMAGSEKAFKKFYNLHAPRRRRSRRDEGWEEWPVLGEGWKRKEVVRQSGTSIGQKDVYYNGPRGERVRSRVELLSVLEGHLDLSHFDYKSGTFFDSNRPPVRIRHRMRKKIRERSSSESSFMERGEGADTPDSYHRLTPNLTSKSVNSSQTSHLWNNTEGSQSQGSPHIKTEDKIKLPFPSSSRPLTLPCINGTSGAGDNPLICAKCGISFIGTWYDKQRKKPCCSTCWASKSKEHPMIRFRKWIPCGQCVGCHNTVNCGQCANCKHGLQSPETRRRVCRKRRCICPIRKGPSQGSYVKKKPHIEATEAFDDNMSLKSEVAESQPSLKNSDTENVSLNIDDDDDDMSTDDDDDWHKKRKRRSCGECKACRCRRDCGTCDFCVDKPKFGGSNKKRQKCRLRQCQRQAMRHLLPFQMGQGDNGPDGPLPGRPKPHYTYSRKSGFKRKKGMFLDADFSDEDDDSNLQPSNCSSEPQSRSKPSLEVNPSNHSDFDVQNGLSDRVTPISNHNSQLPSRWNPGRSRTASNHQQPVEEDEDEDEEEEDDEYDDDEEELPMIANVFSFADNPSAGADVENQLLKLLHSLRSSVLPIMWYAILVEGPQLQLIQCSRQSNMTDTMVLIDPGFCYQVTVQRQPLLPTHPLYDSYPARLTSVTEVVNLLLGLEKYVVCQGLPPRDMWLHRDAIILERASTCDFLVCKTVSICSNCRELQEL